MFDAFLPENTELGFLTPYRLYGYHDGPFLFSARNRSDVIYLALALKSEADAERYLYIPISSRRLQSVERGAISIREAFTHSEDGIAFIASTRDAQSWSINKLNGEDLTDADLPTVDAAFPNVASQDNEPDQMHDLERDEIGRAAIQSNQSIFRIALKFDRRGFFGPASAVSEVVTSLQGCLNAIAQWASGSPKERGAIADSILRQSELLLTGAFTSSVGLEFTVIRRENLFDEGLGPKALRVLLDLMDGKVANDAIGTTLATLNARSISRFHNLLESIVDNDLGFAGATANGDEDSYKLVKLSKAQAADRLAALEHAELTNSEVLEVGPVELVGLHKRRHTYEVRELVGARRKFGGRVLQTAPERVYHSTIGRVYRATLAQITEESDFGETTRNALTDLQEINVNVEKY